MSNIGNKETLSKNLSYYMKVSGRTQKELSEIAGVAPSTFNDWIKAKKYPRIDKIEVLAGYFGILKSDLIEEKLTEAQKKDNDIMADIIVKMRDRCRDSKKAARKNEVRTKRNGRAGRKTV